MDLLKDLQIFHSGWNNNHVFYIHNDILDDDEIDDAHCWIQIYVQNNEMNIHYIKTHKDHTGNGLATYLILNTIFVFQDVTRIELDDCSNNYRRFKNIYTNIGFEYIEDDGPEMIGMRQNILSHIESFKNKYSKNNHYKIKIDF